MGEGERCDFGHRSVNVNSFWGKNALGMAGLLGLMVVNSRRLISAQPLS